LSQIFDSVIQACTPYDPLTLSKNDWLTWVSVKFTVTLWLEEGRVREKFWIYVHGTNSHGWPRPPHYWDFMITVRHTAVGNTALDEWSAQRWDLHLIRHNMHLGQASMFLAGFEPTIPGSELPHIHALNRAASDSWLALNKILGIQIIFL
jgi:hypothetical protein